MQGKTEQNLLMDISNIHVNVSRRGMDPILIT